MARVSVIVPVHNSAPWLRECVDSVMAQTFSDFELILVDDGSTDASPAICDELAAADARIRVLHLPKGGVSRARNAAIETAVGEFVCFIDSDDVINPATLDFGLRVADLTKADEVRWLMTTFADGESPVFTSVDPDEITVTVSEPGLPFSHKAAPMLRAVAPLLQASDFAPRSTGSSCTALYRRSVILKSGVRYPDGIKSGEDYLFNIDFAGACGQIAYTDAVLYHYRRNYTSQSRSFKPDRMTRASEFCTLLREHLEALSYDDAATFSLGYAVCMLRGHFRQLFLSDMPMTQKRDHFQAALAVDCIPAIRDTYPIARLPIMQRSSIKAALARNFVLSMLLVKGRELWKRN